MCLYSLVSTPYIAREPIKCYKILSITKSKVITPFRLVRIPEIPYFLAAKGERICAPSSMVFEVSSGYVHAYVSLKQALHELNCFSLMERIFECVIPEGAFYYIGEYGDICATSMLIQQYNTI